MSAKSAPSSLARVAANPRLRPVPPATEGAQSLARPASLRRRHVLVVISFCVWVLAPVLAAGGYLYGVAVDQYASYVGFSVRREESTPSFDMLGGLGDLTGSSSSDTDILYKFIKGRQMIRAIEAELDLRRIYHRPDDPLFALAPGASQEVLDRYWGRQVRIFYDRNTGLIELRVTAFTPEDAQAIAEAIVQQSSQMLNEMTAIAREDATGYARQELDHALTRLKQARQAMTAFRARTQIIDPAADAQSRMSLLTSLQAQLASALIDLDLLYRTVRERDPRIAQAERRVAVIEARIRDERARFGDGQSGGGTNDYAQQIGEYEALAVDQEFAEKSYLSALASYDAAVAEAQHQSRYLATYIAPTLAQDAEFPRRFLLLALTAGAMGLSWVFALLIYYAVRDRR